MTTNPTERKDVFRHTIDGSNGGEIHRPRRYWTIVAAIAGAGFALAMLGGGDAQAYQSNSGLCDSTITWGFATDRPGTVYPPGSSSNDDTTEIYDQYRGADNPWLFFDNYLNQLPFSITYDSTSPEWNVYWQPFAGTSGEDRPTGATWCSLRDMLVSGPWPADIHERRAVGGVATHEFGHMIGVGHAQIQDQIDSTGPGSGPSTMAAGACHWADVWPFFLDQAESLKTLETDDWAALEQVFDDDMRNINPGFEMGLNGAASFDGWVKYQGTI